MSLENPACFLRDDLHRPRRSSTATHCRSNVFQDPHPHIYPNYTSSIAATPSPTFLQPTLFVLLFSRLLDAVIFTSAIAITAYNYLTGDLQASKHQSQQLMLAAVSSSSMSSTIIPPSVMTDRNNGVVIVKGPDALAHTHRRRTEAWVTDCAAVSPARHRRKRASTYDRPTFASMNKFLTSPTLADNHNNFPASRPKHRSRSFNHDDKESQDEMLARMQTQVENLIQEGRAALTSPINTVNQDDATRRYRDFDDNLYIASSSTTKARHHHHHHQSNSSCNNKRFHQINNRYSSFFP